MIFFVLFFNVYLKLIDHGYQFFYNSQQKLDFIAKFLLSLT